MCGINEAVEGVGEQWPAGSDVGIPMGKVAVYDLIPGEAVFLCAEDGFFSDVVVAALPPGLEGFAVEAYGPGRKSAEIEGDVVLVPKK
jgi:hypothetical protein